jgi:hypothetical protein
MELFAVVGVLVLAAGGWLLYQHSEMQRDLELDKVARRLGMSFRFGLPQELKDVLHRFRAIEKAREAGGEFQAGINSITGTRRQRRVAFFDFQWVTVHYTRRKKSFGWDYEDHPQYRTHVRSAVAAEMGVAVQPILIRPEGLVDKAMALAGYDDIDFAALPEFSRRFYVQSPDREAARRLVTPATARFFLENITGTVDFVGPWLLLHFDSKIPASRAESVIELASRLADQVSREQTSLR